MISNDFFLFYSHLKNNSQFILFHDIYGPIFSQMLEFIYNKCRKRKHFELDLSRKRKGDVLVTFYVPSNNFSF